MNISVNHATTASQRSAHFTSLAGPGFAFHGPDGDVVSAGPIRALPSGTADSLPDRLAAGFAGASPRALIGGAIPFAAANTPDALWIAAQAGQTLPVPVPIPPAVSAQPDGHVITAEPPATDYATAVSRALEAIRTPGNALEKVVLARSLYLRLGAPIDQTALLARLAATDPATTAFRAALPGGGALIGATPELLIAKSGARIRSFPLAGSAARHPDPAQDAQGCSVLAGSDKDRREHALVVEAIMDTLAPLCRELSAPDGTRLTATRSMWHLGTRIEGALRDPSTPVPLLALALHPTPAVCGQPRADAARLIGALEPVNRGYYAGAVGWCDPAGDGAWYVAIRCALIKAATARLFAGAGIVAGSDPDAETAETAAKFGAMLAALGLPRQAGFS